MSSDQVITLAAHRVPTVSRPNTVDDKHDVGSPARDVCDFFKFTCCPIFFFWLRVQGLAQYRLSKWIVNFFSFNFRFIILVRIVWLQFNAEFGIYILMSFLNIFHGPFVTLTQLYPITHYLDLCFKLKVFENKSRILNWLH